MTTGPRPRKNPGGLLRSLRESAGAKPGQGAAAMGSTRDAMSRREAAAIGAIRIEEAAAYLRAFAPKGRIVIESDSVYAVGEDGITLGKPEPVDGESAAVQRDGSAESHGVGAGLNSPARAHVKGRS